MASGGRFVGLDAKEIYLYLQKDSGIVLFFVFFLLFRYGGMPGKMDGGHRAWFSVISVLFEKPGFVADLPGAPVAGWGGRRRNIFCAVHLLW